MFWYGLIFCWISFWFDFWSPKHANSLSMKWRFSVNLFFFFSLSFYDGRESFDKLNVILWRLYRIGDIDLSCWPNVDITFIFVLLLLFCAVNPSREKVHQEKVEVWNGDTNTWIEQGLRVPI